MLLGGSRPVAGIYGERFGKTYMLGATLHDPAYDAFSPGTTLFHLVVEDLIKDKRVASINLGYGYSRYGHRTTSMVLDYASFWLYPKTWQNRLFRTCYTAFRHTAAALKRLLARPSDVALPSRSTGPD